MLTAPALSALPGIRHGFFTRAGGVSEGLYESLNGGIGSKDDASKVAVNRTRMAETLGVAADRFVTAYQIHSPDVIVAEQAWSADARPKGDAIVTGIPRLAIGVSTADCGPVLFADAKARVIGATHAGWRGALTGVIETTIAAMEKLGADRGRMVAALGPMIRQTNYEVGTELVGKFLAEDSGNERFFAKAERDGHAQFDLAGYIGERLMQAGLRKIEDLGFCTYAEPERFFSYRRSVHRAEPDYGRHVNSIALLD